MIDWTASKNDWIADLRQSLIPRLRAETRLVGFGKLEGNFENTIDTWRTTSNFRPVVESANELAVAAALLDRTAAGARVHYERRLLRTRKSIDLCIEAANGALEWIDVKTVAPVWQDDAAAWARFERLSANFPDNARLVVHRGLSDAALAGNALKARWSFVLRTKELEEKRLLLDPAEEGPVRLLLCSGGAWTLDQLEDFADFYRTGQFRDDDWVRNETARYMTERALSFCGTAAGFCYLKRRHDEAFAEDFAHDVRGPT